MLNALTLFRFTVLIKFSQIDEKSAQFWRLVEAQNYANQDPFSEPINLLGNINAFELASHEWIGLIVYFWMGRSSKIL